MIILASVNAKANFKYNHIRLVYVIKNVKMLYLK